MNRFRNIIWGQDIQKDRNIQKNQNILPNSKVQRTSYTIPEIPDAHIDVVIRDDGRRSVSSFYLPSEFTNQGFGQKLLLEALKDGPLVWKDYNITPEANRVYEKLIEKGLAKQVSDEYGVRMIQLATNHFSNLKPMK